MSKWTKLLRENHGRNHEQDELVLTLNPGATIAELNDWEQILGRSLPAEFRDLYSSHNGVGLEDRQEGRIDWCFMPLSLLPKFVEEARGWINDTHPDLALRFFPFYDWLNSDYVGYLWKEDGTVFPRLYEFSHELYEFDSTQPLEQFMIPDQVSIAKFISEY